MYSISDRGPDSRQAKVALKCPSEEDLLLLQAKAQSLHLCARVIRDAYASSTHSAVLSFNVAAICAPAVGQRSSLIH